MYMDMQDGPSSSFQYRGRGGRNNNWRGGGSYQGGYQGDRDNRGGRGGRNYYDNSSQPPRGRYDDEGQENGGYQGGGFRSAPFAGNNFDRGGYRGGGRQQPRGRGSWGNNSRGGTGPGRGRYSGTSSRGRLPPQQQQQGGRGGSGRSLYHDQPKDVEYVASLKGHTAGITALTYDSSSAQLYTGSKDGTVRVWDAGSGRCASVVQVGGRVDSLLLEGGFLFVGLHVQGVAPPPGLIKVWNMATGAQHDLPGHQDEVLALAAAGGMLFSGGKDKSIRAWQFDASAGAFAASPVVITAAQGGHAGPVQALLPLGQWLVSADWLGALKVWDMASGACVQTLQHAHAEPIMGLLAWENVVVSCSLDGTIKVWQPVETPTPGAVLDATPVYVHPPEEPGHPAEAWGGVLAICGGVDTAQRPLLLTSYNDDGCVRLWDLPTFAERGSLPAMKDARALVAVPGDILVAGDKHGAVKIWRWRPTPMPLA